MGDLADRNYKPSDLRSNIVDAANRAASAKAPKKGEPGYEARVKRVARLREQQRGSVRPFSTADDPVNVRAREKLGSTELKYRANQWGEASPEYIAMVLRDPK